MKYLMSFMLTALGLFATTARADEKAPVVTEQLIVLTGHNDCCAPAPCCKPCKERCTTCGKVCEATVEKKTRDHRDYSSKCETFCVPRCEFSLSSFGRKCHSCDGCDNCNTCDHCHNCEKPRTRKVLWVKIRKEEYCVNTCKAVDAPCCPKPCCGGCGTVIVESKPAEKLPTKPMPDKK